MQNGAVGGAPARADADKLAQARKRAALRAVASSLVRQQGYMLLAQIEGELNAPDRAVEGLVWASSATTGLALGLLLLFFLWMMI